MSNNDRRLIEDYLPIEAISKEASREKSVRKGHISTLHLWWARRPLVACRAAVYGALVPASRFIPENGPDSKKQSLGRANAARFVERLCQYPGSPQAIAEAQKHILEAHAERLSKETGKPVTVEDIVEGRAPRPRVLDMFAGGGAIPLEALRLGCEAYALDLNPVAHIIELCTLVYPQKYGKPNPNARGMTGPVMRESVGRGSVGANEKTLSPSDAPTLPRSWGGLAEEVRYWGNWVLAKVKAEIGDLYPPIVLESESEERVSVQQSMFETPSHSPTLSRAHSPTRSLARALTPVAYLWTRTVRCKNPTCGATVPLVRQTWLCKKKDRYVALKMIAPKGKKEVRFEVVESRTEKGLGFDPAGFSKGGNATCPFCGTVADSDYVKAEGRAGRMGQQMMAVVCTRPGRQGKVYLSATDLPKQAPDDAAIRARIEALCRRTGLTVPSEPIEANPRSMDTQHFGFQSWGDLFTPRQMVCLLTFAAAVRECVGALEREGVEGERAKAVATYLACSLDKVGDYIARLRVWEVTDAELSV
jgi:putative DNA methylase